MPFLFWAINFTAAMTASALCYSVGFEFSCQILRTLRNISPSAIEVVSRRAPLSRFASDSAPSSLPSKELLPIRCFSFPPSPLQAFFCVHLLQLSYDVHSFPDPARLWWNCAVILEFSMIDLCFLWGGGQDPLREMKWSPYFVYLYGLIVPSHLSIIAIAYANFELPVLFHPSRVNIFFQAILWT